MYRIIFITIHFFIVTLVLLIAFSNLEIHNYISLKRSHYFLLLLIINILNIGLRRKQLSMNFFNKKSIFSKDRYQEFWQLFK